MKPIKMTNKTLAIIFLLAITGNEWVLAAPDKQLTKAEKSTATSDSTDTRQPSDVPSISPSTEQDTTIKKSSRKTSRSRDFKPSEKISEDTSVAFPVDI